MPTLKIFGEGMPDAPEGINASEGTFKVSGDTPAIGTRTLWAIDDNTAAEQRKA